MIVCPTDHTPLTQKGIVFICERCSYEAKLLDGVIHFHPDINEIYENYHAKGLDTLYKSEQKHFWFKNRRALILKAFKKYVSTADQIIEIGAGTGRIARELMNNGYKVQVGEIHSSGLEYAKSYGVEERYQFDLLRAPFLEHFDVVGMFDVLEHLDDELAVQKIHQILKAGGKVILTVPAHMWLWNRHDALAFHKKRYEVKELQNLFEKNGFRILQAHHFFVSLIPLLYLRKLINPDDGTPPRTEEYKKEFKEPWLINWLLNLILKFENQVVSIIKPKIGGSILLVAQKK